MFTQKLEEPTEIELRISENSIAALLADEVISFNSLHVGGTRVSIKLALIKGIDDLFSQ